MSGTLPRVWTKLSDDRAEALRLWAQREGVREDESTRLFAVVAKRYVREVFPTKSVQTRRDNDKELTNLLRVFGHMPIEAIAPMHIRQYMDLRGQVAKVRADLQPATRTKAIENPRNREEARCARAGTRTNRSLGSSSRPTLA
ncbi:MAG: hypothetical protein M9929_10425 [Burkholderiaceae bacterium]|nr:hypothetical protein [Burkholderiaceae bacterium]